MNLARRSAWFAMTLILNFASLQAQWSRHTASAVPLTADGALDVNAPAPRASDGHPDLSGVWRGGGGTYSMGRPTGFSYPGAQVAEAGSNLVAPLFIFERTAYGNELFKARRARESRDNPRSHCLPMGIVQLHTSAGPAKYIQTPGELVILYEGNGERREIFTDGRTLPGDDVQPWWNGYSVGQWHGNVLVVETTHVRDDGWLDMSGNPLTDAAKISERFRRTAYGRMEIDITIDDRKAYEKPFTVRWNQRLATGDELIESVCAENNRFRR